MLIVIGIGYHAGPREDQDPQNAWDFTCVIDGFNMGVGVCCRDVSSHSQLLVNSSLIIEGTRQYGVLYKLYSTFTGTTRKERITRSMKSERGLY